MPKAMTNLLQKNPRQALYLNLLASNIYPRVRPQIWGKVTLHMRGWAKPPSIVDIVEETGGDGIIKGNYDYLLDRDGDIG
jgi:hypothetical protein